MPDPITLHIPHAPGVAVPVEGDWREFVWPHAGAQTVTCALADLVWYVCCALSDERVAWLLGADRAAVERLERKERGAD